jgi:hypothetical protein
MDALLIGLQHEADAYVAKRYRTVTSRGRLFDTQSFE